MGVTEWWALKVFLVAIPTEAEGSPLPNPLPPFADPAGSLPASGTVLDPGPLLGQSAAHGDAAESSRRPVARTAHPSSHAGPVLAPSREGVTHVM